MKTWSYKKMMDMKPGDKVRITKSNSDCFHIGEIAELTRQDEDGDWWGMFDTGMVEWCLTQKGSCEPDSNPTIADSAIYQHTAYMAEKYKAQRDELLSVLGYWLPTEAPFYGLVGSRDVSVAEHMKKWHEAKAIIKNVEQSL